MDCCCRLRVYLVTTKVWALRWWELLLLLPLVLCVVCRKEAQDLDSAAALKELFPFGHCNLEPAKNYCTHQTQQLHSRRLLTKKVKCQVHPHKKEDMSQKGLQALWTNNSFLKMVSFFLFLCLSITKNYFIKILTFRFPFWHPTLKFFSKSDFP